MSYMAHSDFFGKNLSDYHGLSISQHWYRWFGWCLAIHWHLAKAVLMGLSVDLAIRYWLGLVLMP